MTPKNYDQIIQQHYREVAKTHGLAASSTMADAKTRQSETNAIVRFVETVIAQRTRSGIQAPPAIMDVGCGNGYTLEVLATRFPDCTFIGIELSDELRELAKKRHQGNDNVVILKGDIRDAGFAGDHQADILLCQRVIINILDPQDQKEALYNLLSAVSDPVDSRPNGFLLFIEAFSTPLAKLNEARRELGFEPIQPAHHNLYLPDDFFDIPSLRPYRNKDFTIPPNFLSTHYYVTRVLHPYFTQGQAFKRNSEFVQFFSEALRPYVGDYSPLKLLVFEKVSSD